MGEGEGGGGRGWRISWRCQSERFRVLLWVKSLMRGLEHPASRRLPEKKRDKQERGEFNMLIFITQCSWVKHTEVQQMEVLRLR